MLHSAQQEATQQQAPLATPHKQLLVKGLSKSLMLHAKMVDDSHAVEDGGLLQSMLAQSYVVSPHTRFKASNQTTYRNQKDLRLYSLRCSADAHPRHRKT